MTVVINMRGPIFVQVYQYYHIIIIIIYTYL